MVIMGFIQWRESKIRKMKWYDIPLIKLASIAFGLLLAKLYTPILGFDWYWYAVVIILAAIPPLYHVFKK